MKARKFHYVTVLATGFVVLLLLSLLLFWARFFCEVRLIDIMPNKSRSVIITPSALVPPELEDDPNVFSHSEARAWLLSRESQLIVLGIVDYFEARMSEGRSSNIYSLYRDENDKSWSWLYFDEKTGQINCHYIHKERMPDKTVSIRVVQLYAGPEGVSDTADKTLGRFIHPIADTTAWYMRPLILYDEKLRRFFKINFREKSTTKGPKLGKDDIHKPIQIGYINKNRSIINLNWNPPFIKAAVEDPTPKKAIVVRDYLWAMQQYLLVLDETGRIDLLNSETLEFAGAAGFLPTPDTLFPSKRAVTPKDLLGYEVLPLALKTDHKYRGIYAASVNREGTSMTLAVFDEEGRPIRRKNTDFTDVQRHHGRPIATSKAIFWEVPWAPTLTITKYLLENLHPPILSLASYVSAGSIEAGAGHRALFILSSSFIAMKGRDTDKNMAEKLYTGILIILPSIILAIFLAWRVSISATVVGLSENARICWILATVAFGLAGYITYRLTRPGITLVTCANCGKLRRPDMERCHRCDSRWYVPELIPPTWRVLDTTEQVRDESSELTDETTVE